MNPASIWDSPPKYNSNIEQQQQHQQKYGDRQNRPIGPAGFNTSSPIGLSSAAPGLSSGGGLPSLRNLRISTGPGDYEDLLGSSGGLPPQSISPHKQRSPTHHRRPSNSPLPMFSSTAASNPAGGMGIPSLSGLAESYSSADLFFSNLSTTAAVSGGGAGTSATSSITNTGTNVMTSATSAALHTAGRSTLFNTPSTVESPIFQPRSSHLQNSSPGPSSNLAPSVISDSHSTNTSSSSPFLFHPNSVMSGGAGGGSVGVGILGSTTSGGNAGSLFGGLSVNNPWFSSSSAPAPSAPVPGQITVKTQQSIQSPSKSTGFSSANDPIVTTVAAAPLLQFDNSIYGRRDEYHQQFEDQYSSQTLEDEDSANTGAEDKDRDESGSGPSRSLWVGNIDTSLSEMDLRNIFGQFGEVESIRSLAEKECAFVNFRFVDDAVDAYENMQGGRVGNCIVRVGYGKTIESISHIVDNDSGVTVDASKSLWVGNLSEHVRPSEFLAMFEPYGTIESSRILPGRNCGFINFSTVEEATRAKDALNCKTVGNLPLRIGFARSLTTPSTPSPVQTDVQNVFASARVYESSPPVHQQQQNKPMEHRPIPAVSIATAAPIGPTTNPTDPQLPDESELIMEIPIIESEVFEHTIDPGHLRDIKRKLDHGNPSAREMESIFQEISSQFVQLSTDGFGNTVVQKFIEKCSDAYRLKLIEKCAEKSKSQLSSIGIHKNGTWVVQKMLEFAKTNSQIQMLLNNLKPYIVALLMDPFGNYVVQGCLRLGPVRAQFVFDAMQVKCIDLCQSKFGARAMRACLESQHASKKQHGQIAACVIKQAFNLMTNSNGILLIHWLVDNSNLPGRFTVLVKKCLARVPFLCNQKLASVVMLKVASQTIEPEARQLLIQEGIFKDQRTLASTIFGHPSPTPSPKLQAAEHGTSIVIKCIQTEKDPVQKQTLVRLVSEVIDSYVMPQKSSLSSLQQQRARSPSMDQHNPHLRKLIESLHQ